jgi:hypothetical protein
MSWSASFARPVPKRDAAQELDNLGFAVTQPEAIANLAAIDQLAAAKDCARLLLKSLAGPLVMVRMSGHANGVGWQKKAGHANDNIYVGVTQHMEEDLRYYPLAPEK